MSAPMLPCGRDPVTVAEHAAAGTLDEHERTCPHCRAAADVAALSHRLAEQAAGAAGSDAVEPRRDLVAGAMRSVRTELRTAREIPIPSPDGAAFVTDHVVTTVLRDRLDDAGELAVASCRVTVAPDAGLAVRLVVHARYLQDVPARAEDARRLVGAVLRREFGLDARGGVDVDVVDLIGPQS